MESTQVLELTQTLEASETVESSDVPVKVACLKISGEDYFVWNKENTIGRDESCDIVINNKAVSVEHAIIEADAFGKHLIWDLGSTNKTRLGEVQLKPRVRHYLNDGARLRFANVNAVYHHLKVISPQRPLPPKPDVVQGVQIPGTPERVEEDAAAIASIISETPSKGNENDASSDGDFFGEQDSSALFMNPLRLLDDPHNGSCIASPRIDGGNPFRQDNESTLCVADNVEGAANEGDISDVIAGSQPICTPEKALSIYDVDTVPTHCVEETPVKSSKDDDAEWSDINDSVREISQEMDTLDMLIEKKELCVKFTPSKKTAGTSEAAGKDAPLSAVNPIPSSNPKAANRNLDSYLEGTSCSSKPEDLSSVTSTASCAEPLHGHKVSIYDVETEPLHIIGTKNDGNDNIFDLATQDVHSGMEGSVIDDDTSVYDLATQQFCAPESKKPVQSPVLGGAVSAADLSISDFPTQAALSSDGVGDQGSSNVPSLDQLVSNEGVPESAVPKGQIRKGENPVENSLYDMLTQTTDTISTGTRVSESPAKTDDCTNVRISDMVTQPDSTGCKSGDGREREPKGGCLGGVDIQSDDDSRSGNLSCLNASISEMATQQRGSIFTHPRPPNEIDLPEILTHPTETSSCIADGNQQPSQHTDMSIDDLQTQVVDGRRNHPATSTDVSISDLQTQIADLPQRRLPDELASEDVSISDQQTQVAGTAQKLMPEELKAADVSISDLQTQVPDSPQNAVSERLPSADVSISNLQTQEASDPPSEASHVAPRPVSDDIYDVLTQIHVADHQITCEESNTEKIEWELHQHEKEIVDLALGKTSDGRNGNLSDSLSSKRPTSKEASPGISSLLPTNDVYVLGTQPSRVPSKSEMPTAIISESIFDSATQEAASEPAEISVYDVETEDVVKSGEACEESGAVSVYDLETEEIAKAEGVCKPAAVSEYGLVTHDILKAEEARKPVALSVYDLETQEIDKCEKEDNYHVDTIPLSGAELSKTKILVDKDSSKGFMQGKSPAVIDTHLSKRRFSQDLDTNSVENRIRAMNDRNVNSPDVRTLSSSAKSTVAELLETLEGTPSFPAQRACTPGRSGFSQNSNTPCSQFPREKSPRKVKPLVYSDSEESDDILVGLPSKDDKPLSDQTISAPDDLDKDQNSTSLCSQFPIQKPHKKVKALAYTDSEDSCDTPLLVQRKIKKPLEISADEDCAIYSSNEDEGENTVIAASPASLCNGSSTVSKEGTRTSETVSATLPEAVSGSSNLITSVNDSGGSESLQLQLTDISVNCSIAARSSLPMDAKELQEASQLESSSKCLEDNALETGRTTVASRNPPVPDEPSSATPSESISCHVVSTSSIEKTDAIPAKPNFVDNPKKPEADTSQNVPTSESASANEKSLPQSPRKSEPSAATSTKASSECPPPKSVRGDRENLPTLPLKPVDAPEAGTPSAKPQNEPETPEIPKDFFGSPVIHDRPPLRTYMNRKKLSLNSSSPIRGPNASSTPLSDKDSLSVIDMEETLLTAVPATYAKTVEKAESASGRHDSSQTDTPKNVKKFRKSPVKKPSQDSQCLSQDSETLSSQDELTDSQVLGRGKRKRVRKQFFGYDESDDSAPRKGLSPKPCSSTEVKVVTSSEIREDSAAQPTLDVSRVLEISSETDLPRKERPRKQAFMSCESNEARNTMERYRNDACYVKSPKSEDPSPKLLETTAVVHEVPFEPSTIPVQMDLTRMKNSLKARLSRGQSVQVGNKEIPKVETPIKLRSDFSVLLGDSLLSEKSTSVPKLYSNSSEIESNTGSILGVQQARGRPQKSKCSSTVTSSVLSVNHAGVAALEGNLDTGGANVSKSPVRPGRRRKSNADTCKELSGRVNSQEKGMKVDVPLEPVDQSQQPSEVTSEPISERLASGDAVEMSSILPGSQDLNADPKSPVLPSRGRRRKGNVTPGRSSSSSQGLPPTSSPKPKKDSQTMSKGRRRGCNKELPNSQDSLHELSQESHLSVSSRKDTRTRGARKTPLSSQETAIPGNMDDAASHKRRRRKLCASTDNPDNLEADEHSQNKPTSNDEQRLTHETPAEPQAAVTAQSFLPKRGRGRPSKQAACSTPETQTNQGHASSTEQQGNLNSRNPPELLLEALPESSIFSAKRGDRKRANLDTASVENSDRSGKKLKIAEADESDHKRELTVATEGAAKKTINRRGAKQLAVEDRMNDSLSESQSSFVSVTRRRGKIVAKTSQLPEYSDVQPPVPEYVSTVEATIVTKTQERHVGKKAVKDAADDSLPFREVMSAAEVTSASKTRGRRKKVVEDSADDNNPLQPDPREVSATEVPSASKTRGRRKKVFDPSAEEHSLMHSSAGELSATDVPSSSKTRGRRKKVEDSADDNPLQPATGEISATLVPKSKARGRPKKPIEGPAVDEDRLLPEKASEAPSASKARGRKPKKVVEETPHDDSSQDLSQSRRSGRARKKKESFDELVSRKEEEIRLRKLQQQSQSPGPDKTQFATPCASVASVSDDSAFSMPTSPSSSITSKRSASRLGVSATESLASPSKKRKKEVLPPTPLSGQVKVMFTGLADSKLSAMVKKLGGKVTEKPSDCTVLVTDKVKRTVKFLCALALGKPIVSPNWISKSKAFSSFTDPHESLLKDTEGETKFKFELSSSLEKARGQKLLEGFSMYATASVLPPPKEIKPIIECSGGTFLAKPPAKWPPQSVVISDPKDKSEWPKLTKHGVTPPILSAEALLAGILQQQFDLKTHRLK